MSECRCGRPTRDAMTVCDHCLDRLNRALERLLARIKQVEAGYTTPCWDPGYSRANAGYCAIKVRPDPINKPVHRFAYEQLVGPVSPDLDIDHLCRNRWCCNPAHLEPVTRGENVLRGTSLAAQRKAQTHCKHGHEFSPENTRTWRGHRACRACDAQLARNKRAKEKVA